MGSLSTYIKEGEGPGIIVCCGSGGVGKTTVSAAIGLLGAALGKKTIVLTVDPARRLADALGLKDFSHEPRRVSLDAISSLLPSPPAPLYAMMLDTKQSFDALVSRYASPEFAKLIFSNRYYQHLSNHMAGSHEFMAMENLYHIHHQGLYDLIVLDTPPSRRALDFLEAPQRMLNLLGHPFFLKWFQPYMQAGKWGVRLINWLASPVIRGVGKMVGRQALEDFAGFMKLWDDVLLDGFSRRAEGVKYLLSSPRTLFLAVSTPQRIPMREALFFHQNLSANKMRFGGFIINRVHLSAGDNRGVVGREVFGGMIVDSPFMENILKAHEYMEKLSKSDAAAIGELERQAGSGVTMVQLPAAAHEVGDLKGLFALTRFL